MSRFLSIVCAALVVGPFVFVLGGCPEAEPVGTITTADPLVRLSPSVGGRGMNITLQLRGVNTQWADGEISIDLGTDILIAGVTVEGPNFATVDIAIDDNAVLGFRPVTIEFFAGEGDARVLKTFTLQGDEGFLVEPGGIAITPDRARLGETLQVKVEGFNPLLVGLLLLGELKASNNGRISGEKRINLLDDFRIVPVRAIGHAHHGDQFVSLLDGHPEERVHGGMTRREPTAPGVTGGVV